jgi:hypothetical protein
MGNIDKITGIPENLEQEEKVESTVEASENTEGDAFDVWVKKHIGERNLTDVYKFAAKRIRRAGQLKLKYFAYAVKYTGYAIGFVLGCILGWILICGIYCGFTHIFDMMTGDTDSYRYAFFDGDLWATIIISVIVACCSFWVWHKGAKGFLYFIFLWAMAEYLDYSFLELNNADYSAGKICFWLFFVVIPILQIIYYGAAPTVSVTYKEDVRVDSSCEKTAETSEE